MTAETPASSDATFIIDPERTLRAMVYYPMTNGRSAGEFLRLIQALQTRVEHKVATPGNWPPGEDVIASTPQTTEAAEACLTGGFQTKDWYFSTRAL